MQTIPPYPTYAVTPTGVALAPLRGITRLEEVQAELDAVIQFCKCSGITRERYHYIDRLQRVIRRMSVARGQEVVR